MNPIISIYKLMGFNVSNADEEDSQSIRDSLNSLKDDNIRFRYEITELNTDDTRLNGKVSVLEEENARLNGKISFLEKECLYSELENNAIQLLNYKKRINVIDKLIENNNVFITLSDVPLTMTKFKVRYQGLLDNRHGETHPLGISFTNPRI